ncbi:MAG: phospholipase D family protein [Gammaproteobacteria bacterium]|nr:phospholipase D family protein [Gammaproteobacteria bacterium]
MILLSGEFTKELISAIRVAEREYLIACAFIKLGALETLADNFAGGVDKVTIIARWQKRDLIAGVSDLEVFEYCRDRGWRFGVDRNLHGKLYLIDQETAFLGSANLTRSGLSIGGIGNSEFGTRMDMGEIDKQKINKFVSDDVTWVTNDLFLLISSEVCAAKDISMPAMEHSWSLEIASKLTKAANYLWIDELFFSSPTGLLRLNLSDGAVLHDFDLLGLDFDDITEGSVTSAFRRSKMYSWLSGRLSKHGSMNFGLLSHELHNAILNDPAPYRKDIKDFVRIIFEWCEYDSDTFAITNYSRTKSIALKVT